MRESECVRERDVRMSIRRSAAVVSMHSSKVYSLICLLSSPPLHPSRHPLCPSHSLPPIAPVPRPPLLPPLVPFSYIRTHWLLFDAVATTSALISTIMEQLPNSCQATGGQNSLRVVSLLRLMRFLRALRMLRVVLDMSAIRNVIKSTAPFVPMLPAFFAALVCLM